MPVNSRKDYNKQKLLQGSYCLLAILTQILKKEREKVTLILKILFTFLVIMSNYWYVVILNW